MTPPLVQGGQGRSEQDVRHDAAVLMFVCLFTLFLAAALSVVWWLTGGALA